MTRLSVVGIDPGLQRHYCVRVQGQGTFPFPPHQFKQFDVGRVATWRDIDWVDWTMDSTSCRPKGFLEADVYVMEMPQHQGSLRNAVPVVREASALLLRLYNTGRDVYTPYPPAINRVVCGTATPKLSAKIQAVRDVTGLETGRGTLWNTTPENAHYIDALLAALWFTEADAAERARFKWYVGGNDG